jgi:hypothetical protein
MIQKIIFPNKPSLISLIPLFTALFMTNPDLVSGQKLQKEQHFGRTTQARLAVEKAWDVYHDGALGGTLQSPKIQTILEADLHKSRALLAEAYDAEDGGDLKKTMKLIKNIMQITHKVIAESKVEKK